MQRENAQMIQIEKGEESATEEKIRKVTKGKIPEENEIQVELKRGAK